MSQHPSRNGPSPYGSGPTGWPPVNRNTTPSPFRPASPFSPPPLSQYSPQFQQSQQTFGPAQQPSNYYATNNSYNQSPVQSGAQTSRMFCASSGSPGFIECPKPKWPSPISPGNSTARPFIPLQQKSTPSQVIFLFILILLKRFYPYFKNFYMFNYVI